MVVLRFFLAHAPRRGALRLALGVVLAAALLCIRPPLSSARPDAPAAVPEPVPTPAPVDPAAAQQPLRVAYPEFWPFCCRNAEGRMVGFFPDILREALTRRMHVPLVWQAFPWARCQNNVRIGLSDALVTVPTEERLAYSVTHPTPVYRKPLDIFTYAGHPRMPVIQAVRSPEDILRAHLTVITYLGNGWNEEHVASLGVRIEKTANLESVWGMLARRRGDIVIEWPGGAWPDIRAAGVEDKVVDTGVTLDSMPFHLLVRKDSPYAALLPRFDEIIAALHRDGTIRRIVDSYVGRAGSGGPE